jgi:hypothetical protein
MNQCPIFLHHLMQENGTSIKVTVLVIPIFDGWLSDAKNSRA